MTTRDPRRDSLVTADDGRRSRAVSTVLDVATCLLLVSAAVTVLATAAPPAGDGGPTRPASEVADSLGTSTAQVSYSVVPTDRDVPVDVDSPERADGEFERTAHGTLASLLASTVVADARVDGERLLPRDGFERATTNATSTALAEFDAAVRVDARWEPYPGAAVSGTATVGAEPPADADVRAATLTPSSGIYCSGERAERAAEHDGFDGVAEVVADCLVDGLLPPEALRRALHGGPVESVMAEQRFHRVGSVLGVDVDGPVARNDPANANERLAAALADRIAGDLRETYDEPTDAAANLAVDEVQITVRTW